MNDRIQSELDVVMTNWNELGKQVQLNPQHTCPSINILVSATMDILLDFKLLTNPELLDAEYRNTLQLIFKNVTKYSQDSNLKSEVYSLYDVFNKGWKSKTSLDLLNGKMASQSLESREYLKNLNSLVNEPHLCPKIEKIQDMLDNSIHKHMYQIGYNFIEAYKKYLITNRSVQEKFTYKSASNLLYCLLIGTSSLNQHERLLSLVNLMPEYEKLEFLRKFVAQSTNPNSINRSFVKLEIFKSLLREEFKLKRNQQNLQNYNLYLNILLENAKTDEFINTSLEEIILNAINVCVISEYYYLAADLIRKALPNMHNLLVLRLYLLGFSLDLTHLEKLKKNPAATPEEFDLIKRNLFNVMIILSFLLEDDKLKLHCVQAATVINCNSELCRELKNMLDDYSFNFDGEVSTKMKDVLMDLRTLLENFQLDIDAGYTWDNLFEKQSLSSFDNLTRLVTNANMTTLAPIEYPGIEPGYGKSKSKFKSEEKYKEGKEKDKDPSYGSRNGHRETSDEEKVSPKKNPIVNYDYTTIHKEHDQFLDKIRNLFRNIPTEEVKEVEESDLLEVKRGCNDPFLAKKLYCDVITIYPEFSIEDQEVYFMEKEMFKLGLVNYKTYFYQRCQQLQKANLNNLIHDFTHLKENYYSKNAFNELRDVYDTGVVSLWQLACGPYDLYDLENILFYSILRKLSIAPYNFNEINTSGENSIKPTLSYLIFRGQPGACPKRIVKSRVKIFNNVLDYNVNQYDFLVGDKAKFKCIKRKLDGEEDEINGEASLKKNKVTIKIEPGLEEGTVDTSSSTDNIVKKGRPPKGSNNKRPPYIRPPRKNESSPLGEKKPRPSNKQPTISNASRVIAIGSRNLGMGVIKPPLKVELDQKVVELLDLLKSLTIAIKNITGKSIVFDASQLFNELITWKAWADTATPEPVASKISVVMTHQIQVKSVSKIIETSFDCKFFGSLQGRIDIDAEVSHHIDYDDEFNPIIVTKYHTIKKFSGFVFFLEGWKTFRADLKVEGEDTLDARFRLISGMRHKPGRSKRLDSSSDSKVKIKQESLAKQDKKPKKAQSSKEFPKCSISIEALNDIERTINAVVANDCMEEKEPKFEADSISDEIHQTPIVNLFQQESKIPEIKLENSPIQIVPTKGQQKAFEILPAHQEYQSQLLDDKLLSTEPVSDILADTDDGIMILEQEIPQVDLTKYSVESPSLANPSNSLVNPTISVQVIPPNLSGDLPISSNSQEIMNFNVIPPFATQNDPMKVFKKSPEFQFEVSRTGTPQLPTMSSSSLKPKILDIQVISPFTTISKLDEILNAPAKALKFPQNNIQDAILQKIEIKEDIVIVAAKKNKENPEENALPNSISMVESANRSTSYDDDLDIEAQLNVSFLKVPDNYPKLCQQRDEKDRLRKELAQIEIKKELERQESLKVEQKKLEEHKRIFEHKEEARIKERLKNELARKQAELAELKIKMKGNKKNVIVLLSDSEEDSGGSENPKNRLIKSPTIKSSDVKLASCKIEMKDMFPENVKRKLHPGTKLEIGSRFVSKQIKQQEIKKGFQREDVVVDKQDQVYIIRTNFVSCTPLSRYVNLCGGSNNNISNSINSNRTNISLTKIDNKKVSVNNLIQNMCADENRLANFDISSLAKQSYSDSNKLNFAKNLKNVKKFDDSHHLLERLRLDECVKSSESSVYEKLGDKVDKSILDRVPGMTSFEYFELPALTTLVEVVHVVKSAKDGADVTDDEQKLLDGKDKKESKIGILAGGDASTSSTSNSSSGSQSTQVSAHIQKIGHPIVLNHKLNNANKSDTPIHTSFGSIIKNVYPPASSHSRAQVDVVSSNDKNVVLKFLASPSGESTSDSSDNQAQEPIKNQTLINMLSSQQVLVPASNMSNMSNLSSINMTSMNNRHFLMATKPTATTTTTQAQRKDVKPSQLIQILNAPSTFPKTSYSTSFASVINTMTTTSASIKSLNQPATTVSTANMGSDTRNQGMMQFICKTDGKTIHLTPIGDSRKNFSKLNCKTQQITIRPPEAQRILLNHNVKRINDQNILTIVPKSEDGNNQLLTLAPIEDPPKAPATTSVTSIIQQFGRSVIHQNNQSLPQFNQVFGKTSYQTSLPATEVSPKTTSSMATIQKTTTITYADENIRSLVEDPKKSEESIPTDKTPTNQQQINLQTLQGGLLYARPYSIANGKILSNNNNVLLTTLRNNPNNVRIISTMTPEGGRHNAAMMNPIRISVPFISRTSGVDTLMQSKLIRPVIQIQPQLLANGQPQKFHQQFVIATSRVNSMNSTINSMSTSSTPNLKLESLLLAAQQQQQQDQEMEQNRLEEKAKSDQKEGSSTMEQLREFDMVLEQMKERATPTLVSPTLIVRQEVKKEDQEKKGTTMIINNRNEIVYSVANQVPLLQKVNMAFAQKQQPKITASTPVVVATNYCATGLSSPALSVTSQSSTSSVSLKTETNTFHKTMQTKSIKVKSPENSLSSPSDASKSSPAKQPVVVQKSQEDEQTAQRIYDILAEYAEQLRNSPDLNNKPAPRRRTNPPTNPPTPSSSSKRKKSSSGNKKSGSNSDLSPDNDQIMNSEDSSYSGEASSSADNSPRGGFDDQTDGSLDQNYFADANQKEPPQLTASTVQSGQAKAPLARRLIFTDTKSNMELNPQPPKNFMIANTSQVSGDGQTAVLMPGNYLLPMNVLKSGQQLTILSSNNGQKILAMPANQQVINNANGGQIFLQRFLNQQQKAGQAAQVSQVENRQTQFVTGNPAFKSFRIQQPNTFAYVNNRPTFNGNSNTLYISPIQSVPTQHVPTATKTIFATSNSTTLTSASFVNQVDQKPVPKLEFNYPNVKFINASTNEVMEIQQQPPQQNFVIKFENDGLLKPKLEKIDKYEKIEKIETLDQKSKKRKLMDEFDEDLIKFDKCESDQDSSHMPGLVELSSRSNQPQVDFRKESILVMNSPLTLKHEVIEKIELNQNDNARDSYTHHEETEDLKEDDKKKYSGILTSYLNNSGRTSENRIMINTNKGHRIDPSNKILMQQLYNDRKQAALEKELRLQKSLSEECEDLGVDEPMASDLFPEADLLFDNASPSFDQIMPPEHSFQLSEQKFLNGDNRATAESDDSSSSMHKMRTHSTFLKKFSYDAADENSDEGRLAPSTACHQPIGSVFDVDFIGEHELDQHAVTDGDRIEKQSGDGIKGSDTQSSTEGSNIDDYDDEDKLPLSRYKAKRMQQDHKKRKFSRTAQIASGGPKK